MTKPAVSHIKYINTSKTLTSTIVLGCSVLATSSAYAFDHDISDLSTDTPLIAMQISEERLPSITPVTQSTAMPAEEISKDSPVDNDSNSSQDEFDDAFAMDDETSSIEVSDPLEAYNRFVFKMNTGLDNRVAKPIAKGYKRITPKPVRSGIGHFFSNLAEPWTAVNLLLQGKPISSVKSLGRFTINTVTTLGLADAAASEFDLTTTREDFGQTLGVWGIPSGPYLVLPVLGPSTLRDSGGRIIDATGSPLTYTDRAISTSLSTVNGINKRAQLLSFEGLVNANDYEVVRDVYLQKREFDIKERGSTSGQTADQNPDEKFEESFGD